MMKSTSMKKAFLGMFASLMIAGSVNAAAQVNISGATLFKDFFQNENSTKDYIDADGDGLRVQDSNDTSLSLVERLNILRETQLATPWDGSTDPATMNTDWYVTYRGVGSGSGLAELVKWYNADPSAQSDLSVVENTDNAFNTVSWLTNIHPTNPGGAPVDQNGVDIAVMDVPTVWFVQNGDTADAAWSNTPGTSGYGKSPVMGWDNVRNNKLKTLGNGLTLDMVVDTQIAWVPIAIIANPGVGSDVTMSTEELQYLFLTGRAADGKNLQVCTRDSGSGTRNGAMNSLGIDPSWGRGENLGDKQPSSSAVITSAGFQTSNLDGSSVMENAVQNVRLGVGYTGLMGGSRAAKDSHDSKYNIVGVDFGNGVMYPEKENVFWFDGTNILPLNEGWTIGGSETMATVGDPFAAGYAHGVGANDTTKMANEAAAMYIQNIVASAETFIHDPADPNTGFTPAEVLASEFTLIKSMPYLPNLTDPTSFVDQAGYAATALAASYDASTLYDFNTDTVGRMPARAAGSYSDNAAAAAGKYYSLDGTAIDWSVSAAAHLVTGDMNRNGVMDAADLTALVAYVTDKAAYTAQYASTEAGTFCPEIIADFNVDGSVDADDVRYFADGLYMVDGKLNRAAAFAVPAVVELLGENAMYDIAGNSVVAAGAAPMGYDGMVNTADAAYMVKVLSGGLVGEMNNPFAADLDWNNIDDAVKMDLSCDMNGDLKVNQEDLVLMLEMLPENDPFFYMIGTADFDMDGDVDVVDFADFASKWLK